jgi:hypothetical protein
MEGAWFGTSVSARRAGGEREREKRVREYNSYVFWAITPRSNTEDEEFSSTVAEACDLA